MDKCLAFLAKSAYGFGGWALEPGFNRVASS
jgi:hypothetical protein